MEINNYTLTEKQLYDGMFYTIRGLSKKRRLGFTIVFGIIALWFIADFILTIIINKEFFKWY